MDELIETAPTSPPSRWWRLSSTHPAPTPPALPAWTPRPPYLPECPDGTDVVGSTWKLGRRLFHYTAGDGDEYTRTRRRMSLLCVEEHYLIDDALARDSPGHTRHRPLTDRDPRDLTFHVKRP